MKFLANISTIRHCKLKIWDSVNLCFPLKIIHCHKVYPPSQFNIHDHPANSIHDFLILRSEFFTVFGFQKLAIVFHDSTKIFCIAAPVRRMIA